MLSIIKNPRGKCNPSLQRIYKFMLPSSGHSHLARRNGSPQLCYDKYDFFKKKFIHFISDSGSLVAVIWKYLPEVVVCLHWR